MDKDARVECPICAEEIPLSDINLHVDQCLCRSSINVKSTEKQSKSIPSQEQQETDNNWHGKLLSNETISPKPFYEVLGKRKRTEQEIKSPKESPKMKKLGLNRDIFEIANDKTHATAGDSVETEIMSNQNSSYLGTVTSDSSFIKRPENSATSTESSLKQLRSRTPLAEQMRPDALEEYIGQSVVTNSNTPFIKLIRATEIPSLILWGPPGCGKTTLAHIIGCYCKKSGKARFIKLSATSGSVNEAREVIRTAKNEKGVLGRRTVMFIDEIHRFNKLQQDVLLPHVENGTIILIGATTENPSFYVNNPLLSRCKVIVLEKLKTESIRDILIRSVNKLDAVLVNRDGCILNNNSSESDTSSLKVEFEAVNYLAQMCDGDARIALNGLDIALRSIAAEKTDPVGHDSSHYKTRTITLDMTREAMQRSHVPYDKHGDEHYNMASALQKSIRGGDDNASLYWLARMLEGGENPLFVARRLIRIASEDVGIADVKALQVAVAAYQASHLIGMPECDAVLAEAAVYLARAPKSFEIYFAYEKAKALIKQGEGPVPGVPLHLRNAPTKLMKNLGYSVGYKHDPSMEQTYLPKELQGINFFDE